MNKKHEDIKILIVEDENIARMVLVSILGKRFGDIISAKNGKEGLDKFNEESPDIIITDLEMPVMSGIEMIGKIRNTNATTPIIVTTAYADIEYKVGEIQYQLIKPIMKDDLFYAIDSLI